MMEFTLSRVALAVVGIALLAAVVPTMAAVYDDRVDAMGDDHAERMASVFDSFAGSSADTMVLNMGTILPGTDAVATFDGRTVEVSWGGDAWIKGMRLCEFNGPVTVSGGDCVRFTKEGGKVDAEILTVP
ncbi:MAG: hypothetical protein GX224_04660 [Thermoplasmatales archaeon]|nr:hypothetical protein [Thermoplasmatales archaeon]